MRNKVTTLRYYVDQLGFKDIGHADFAEYLIIEKEGVELHFFLFPRLNPYQNYGQVYIRTNQIEKLYKQFLDEKVLIHPNGELMEKPWGQLEFSLLDPDHNLLTFGEAIKPPVTLLQQVE